MPAPYEILAGPLDLWLAPVGTAFPLVTAAPAGPWAMVGTAGRRNYSDDGLAVQHTQKIDTATPAGAIAPVKAWRTEEGLIITVTMWDLSLEHYTTALGGAVPTTVAAGAGIPGTKKIGLSRGPDVVTYALLARGASAYGDAYKGQYEVPVCFQNGSPKPTFAKGKPSGLEMEFMALEHSAAATELERFGRLIMQHAAPLP
ncbi:MAG: hypothetical protein ACT6Q5_13295 [Sphingopyxis solisilvae]|uniref:hypothetical protein n=1 Tax=Sphingopyxis solisilvae TaxID=1886788 RepID=UPI004036FEA4